MKTYRKKPVEVQALQWTTDNEVDMSEFVTCDHRYVYSIGSVEFYISTLEGEMQASPGDFIIKGVQGEFYPCKPEIFAATYEEVPS